MTIDNKENHFKEMVDWIVLNCGEDQELKDGLKWVENNIKGDNIYDKLMEVLYKHDVNQKASNWLRDRN